MDRKLPIETPPSRETGMAKKSAPSSAATAQNPPLDINSYSLDEIFDLFNLTYDLTMDDLKQAKTKVLMLHPDKSKLPPEYFIFYKRAFERVVEVYEDLQKQNRPITKESTKYNANVYKSRENVFNEGQTSEMTKSIQQQSKTKEFNKKFNDVFEKNMSKRPDETRNHWFTSDKSTFEIDNNVRITKDNMESVMDDLKAKNSAVMLHRGGFNELYSRNHGISKIFDEEEDPNEYVSSDIFDKLRFEDIRKVHKDETIIPVRPADVAEKVAKTKAMTVDQYIEQRSASSDAVPIAKIEAERILAEKERMEKERFMSRQYKSKIQSDEYEKKNNEIMSHFMRLTH